MAAGDEDVVIAVMGVTGCGKSTFIQKVTGRSDVKIGESLASETAVVEQYSFAHKKVNYILVDTIGFDDSKLDNETILKRIIEWLASSFRAGVRLDGLIYLHRITDKRMSGSSFETLRMFRNLCGEQGLKNVVLVSTFWDTVASAEGEKRQKELETNPKFWSRMIEKGCRTARLDGTRNRCLEILEEIALNNNKVTIQIQHEIVVQGKSLNETVAARQSFAKFQTEMEERAKQDAENLRQDEQRRLKQIEDNSRRERQRLAEKLEKEQKEEAERRRLVQEHIKKEEEAERARELAAQEKRLNELKEREERLAEEKKEEKARQARLDSEAKKAYYRNYTCLQRSVSHRRCDKCADRLHSRYTYYYHCCHCDYDDYNHCGACGNNCGTAEHPLMSQRETLDECIVM